MTERSRPRLVLTELSAVDVVRWVERGTTTVERGTMNTEQDLMAVLAPHDCWELLRAVDVGRLAVAINQHPDIFPINYVTDHGTIVFRTAEGTKLAAAVLGVGVAFEIDGLDAAAGEAWSVVVKGTAVEIERMQELFDALELPLFPWHTSPKHRFVRIVPHEITGRRFRVVAGVTKTAARNST